MSPLWRGRVFMKRLIAKLFIKDYTIERFIFANGRFREKWELQPVLNAQSCAQSPTLGES